MRILDSISAAIIFSLMMLPAAASAQSIDATGSDSVKMRMKGFDDLFFQNSARAGVNIMALCRAKKRPERAIQTLSTAYLSDSQMKSLDKFLALFRYDSSCTLTNNVDSELPSAGVIGGMSEYFLLLKYSSDEIESIVDMVDADWNNNLMTPRTGVEQFGQCVLRADAMKAFQLINTIPDTAAESAAFKAVVPLLGPCLMEGAEVKFDKTSLRALLAFALYRTVQQHQKMLEAAE